MEPLKNMFNPDVVDEMSQHILAYYPKFDIPTFTMRVFDSQWASRELKERMRHITVCLREALPTSYEEAVRVLMSVSDAVKGGELKFAYMVLPDFVEVYGQDDWELSMEALGVVTQSSSSEFAVRPFLVSHRDQTLARMLSWAEHTSVHVRRFASEGSRPRLPWGMALNEFKKDPSYTLPILERLKADPELYVRRSVANHLNDISKDHEDVALDTAVRWYGKSAETDWVVKHAMRGLLKKGNVRAMRLFGFAEPHNVRVNDIVLSLETCQIGETVNLSCGVDLEESMKIRLEYAVDYVKQNGSVSRKVFMMSEKEMPSGESVFAKKLDFSDKTTRRHYAGEHRITLLVNGVEKGNVLLQLHDESK